MEKQHLIKVGAANVPQSRFRNTCRFYSVNAQGSLKLQEGKSNIGHNSVPLTTGVPYLMRPWHIYVPTKRRKERFAISFGGNSTLILAFPAFNARP